MGQLNQLLSVILIVYLIHSIRHISIVSGQQTNPSPSSSPTYTIIAPAKLRPNADYHVSVSVHNVNDHVDVDISIQGQDQESGNFNSVSKTVIVNSDETRILNFEIGEWGPGIYRLNVVGKGALSFRNETTISFEAKSYSVFIQTDKAIYKPGQLVQFRAIVVNPSLLPSVTGAINIYVNVSNQYSYLTSIHHILLTSHLNLEAFLSFGATCQKHQPLVNSIISMLLTITSHVFEVITVHDNNFLMINHINTGCKGE